MAFISKCASDNFSCVVFKFFCFVNSNYAVHVNSRSTVVAGTAGQSYVDNIFFNPDNDYEMITVNKSL